MSYTPFLKPQRRKDVDGVWRHKESGKLLYVKNVWVRGFIDGETEQPYDGYQGTFQFEGEEPIKKCIIECDQLYRDYRRVFRL